MLAKKTYIIVSLLLFACCLIVVFVAFFEVSSKQKVFGPNLTFDQMEFDAGIIGGNQSTTIRHTFKISNKGTAELVITGTKTSCGCTVIDKPQMPLPPGEGSEITASLTLGQTGRKNVNILIESNSPDSPHKLKLSADYRPDSEASAMPLKMRLDKIASNSREAFPLVINTFMLSSESVQIKNIITENEMFEVVVKKITKNKYANQLGYYRTTFELEVTPTMESFGDFKDNIAIDFLPLTIKQVEVPISGHVVRDWVVTPSKTMFVFSRKKSSDIMTRKIIIKHIEEKDFTVQGIRNPFGEYLAVKYKQFGSQVQVEMAFDSDKYLSNEQNVSEDNISLVIDNDSLENSTVDIPIKIILL